MKNGCRLFLLACLTSIAACESTTKNSELTIWPTSDAIEVVAFTHAEEESLTGNGVKVGDDSGITLARDKDTLTISWQNSGWGGVHFHSKAPTDVRALREGFLQLTMQVNSVEDAGVEFALLGSDGMERRLPMEQQLQALVGKGPVAVALPMQCLLRENDNAASLTTPLRLALGGSGQLTVESAAIVLSATPSAVMLTCPDRSTIAITPAMLDTHWAKSWWLPRHQQKLQEAAESDPEIVFLGDSITQGWENEGAEVFAEYFGHWHTLNLGFGGDRTENVLWRLQHGAVDEIKPKLVVMMIGTNNTGHRLDEPAQVAEGVDKILQELQARLPESKVLLLAIFPRSATAAELPRRNNTLINARLRNLADGEQVFFHDLNSVFLDRHGNLPEEVMPDLLHPNAHGYSLLAQKLAPLVDALLNTP